MNKRRQFTAELKQEAAAQVIERGYPIREVAEHLAISNKTLYNPIRKHGTNSLLSPQQYEDRYKMNNGVV